MCLMNFGQVLCDKDIDIIVEKYCIVLYIYLQIYLVTTRMTITCDNEVTGTWYHCNSQPILQQ